MGRVSESDGAVTRRVLLRGGLVADGIGSAARRGDVLIDGDTIASVERPRVGRRPRAGGRRARAGG